ncbi:solute carrier family 49 member 4-like [Liolophura sinensis]|uniref:solute carrier family 49 member 4-like n=1 Tax=Liolophura sinensis TaxID=3198878 RepID=UPI003158BBEC
MEERKLRSVVLTDVLHGNDRYSSQYNSVHGSVSEERSAPAPSLEVKVYKRRFYILFMFSMSALAQAAVWNTWGPVSQSAKQVFGWTDGDIALLANWGPISFIISLYPFSWIMDVKGLRWALISCSFVVAAGAALRCITFQQPYATWLIHGGQFLNGLGGPVAMAACTVVSSTWFPPNQRTISTSIGNLLNAVGVAVSFIIGIWPRGYLSAGFCVAVFLGILLYFPAKPPLPPSTTASVKRVDFKTGTLALLCHTQFWVISSIYGVCLGTINCWMSVLDVVLNPLGISQETAGWMGFYSIIGGTIAVFVVAIVADIFSKRMKVILVALYLMAGGNFLWLALISGQYIPSNSVHVWISVIAGNTLITAGVPLIYELACEITFPISESVTTSALAMYNNVAGLIFLLVMMIPNINVSWTNWCVLGTVLFCVPLLLLLKDKYKRLDMDLEMKAEDKSSPGDLLDNPTLGLDIQAAFGYYCDPVTLTIETRPQLFPNLKTVVCVSTGFDHMDMEKYKQLGIRVYNCVSYSEATAEHAFLLILATARDSFKNVIADIVKQLCGICGESGRFSPMSQPDLLNFDLPTRRDSRLDEEDGFVYASSLALLLQEIEYILVTCPLTDETRLMIGQEHFKMMKSTAAIVNVARAEIIDQDALLDALQREKLR